MFQPNITDADKLIDYLQTQLFSGATREHIEDLVSTYDSSIIAGSPFNTGIFNNPYPEFKRLAAILGDLVFTLTRRIFLNSALAANPDVPSWSYLASYDYGTPILGTFHASDILQVFYGLLPNYASKAIQSYYISFLYTMDPNNGTSSEFLEWPQWKENKELMQFYNDRGSLLADNFRSGSYDWITGHVKNLYF